MAGIAERLKKRIVVEEGPDGHWLWSGGWIFNAGGSMHRPRRVVWEVFGPNKGHIPPDQMIISTCAAENCVRPEHSTPSGTKSFVLKKRKSVEPVVPPRPKSKKLSRAQRNKVLTTLRVLVRALEAELAKE